jgi:hypothetical protein
MSNLNMRCTLKANEGVEEGSHVRTSSPKAGEVVQHLVTASFEVVFEESDKSMQRSAWGQRQA